MRGEEEWRCTLATQHGYHSPSSFLFISLLFFFFGRGDELWHKRDGVRIVPPPSNINILSIEFAGLLRRPDRHGYYGDWLCWPRHSLHSMGGKLKRCPREGGVSHSDTEPRLCASRLSPRSLVFPLQENLSFAECQAKLKKTLQPQFP